MEFSLFVTVMIEVIQVWNVLKYNEVISDDGVFTFVASGSSRHRLMRFTRTISL